MRKYKFLIVVFFSFTLLISLKIHSIKSVHWDHNGWAYQFLNFDDLEKFSTNSSNEIEESFLFFSPKILPSRLFFISSGLLNLYFCYLFVSKQVFFLNSDIPPPPAFH